MDISFSVVSQFILLQPFYGIGGEFLNGDIQQPCDIPVFPKRESTKG